MNFLKSRYIPSSNPWEPNFSGVFWNNGASNCFVYKDIGGISILPYYDQVPSIIGIELEDACLPLPHYWLFAEICNRPYLMVEKNIVVDLLKEEKISCLSETIQSRFAQYVRHEVYYETYDFILGEYCVLHKGQCGYRCTKDGKTIWDFNGKAYLYTDIYRRNNNIFFGTAGYGGYFYVLNIENGKPLACIKTGGTAYIAQRDHLCFITSKAHKKNASKLLCVDLNDGKIVEELELYGGVTKDSKLQLIGPQLHVVTFEYQNERCVRAIWNVIEI